MRTALVILFASAAALHASAQEKFAPKVDKGDKWTVKSDASLTLHMVILGMEGGVEGETREKHLKTKRTEMKEISIAEVGPGGKPSAWGVKFPESKLRTGEPNAPDSELETKTTELEGKEYQVEGDEVKPDEASTEAKTAAKAPEGFWAVLPKKGSANLNESWEIDPEKFARVVVMGTDLAPVGSKARVTLSEIQNDNGSRIAVLAIDGTLDVATKQGFKITWTMTGSLRYDLDKQLPVSLSVNGEATKFDGAIADGRGVVAGKVDGKGSTFRMDVFYSSK